MKTNMNLSMRRSVARVIGRMAIDAALGATCAGLYGFVFSGFGALAQDQSHRLISIAGTFVLCGAVAGGLWGACSGIFNSNERTSEANDFSSAGSEKNPTPVETVRHLMVPSQRQPQNSLTAASSSDRRRMLTVAAEHPLSC